MGVRIMVEILDHAPPELSDKETRALLALAEKANDHTRIGWPGLPLLAHRAHISIRRIGALMGRLVAKGVIELVRAAGGRNRPAVYRIVDLRGLAARRAGGTVPTPPPSASLQPDFDLQDILGSAGGTCDATVPAVEIPVDEAGDNEHRAARNGDVCDGNHDVCRGKGDAAAPRPARRPDNPQGSLKEPSPSRGRARGRGKADEDIAKVVADAIAEKTGWTKITPEWAEQVARQILAESSTPVHSPPGYLRYRILSERDPSRLLPTPAPSKWVPGSASSQCGHGDPRGPHACAPCRNGVPAYA